MSRTLLTAAALCLVASASAVAGDARPRLVAGGNQLSRHEGSRFAGKDQPAELYAIGGLRVGALLDSTPAAEAPDRIAMGGYAAYVMESFSIASTLRGDDSASAADLSAAYASGAGTTQLSVGYEWAGRPAAFSINPVQAGSGFDTSRPLSDLSVSLSFTHDVTPSLHLGGFAAASRSEYEDRTTEHGFRLGAGIGYKF